MKIYNPFTDSFVDTNEKNTTSNTLSSLDALDKIDTSVCIAFNKDNDSIFGIDEETHSDCVTIDEYCDCFVTISNDLKLLKVLRDHYNIALAKAPSKNGGWEYELLIMNKEGEVTTKPIKITKEEWDYLQNKDWEEDTENGEGED